MKNYKIVIFVPVTHAEDIRELLGESGAGKIGNYDYASFSVLGTGRFRPLKGAHPAVGKVGKLEKVTEERIETVVSGEILNEVVSKVRKAHPYEEPVIDIYELFSPPAEGKGRVRGGKVRISGIVKKHLGRGKELGFPTANIDIDNGIEDGIYVGYTVIAIRRGGEAISRDRRGLRPRDDDREKKLSSLVFIGAAETFGETERGAEVYILDFKGDLYGKHIEVELLQKIRASQKFATEEELVAQMKKDEQQARDFFNLSSPT